MVQSGDAGAGFGSGTHAFFDGEFFPSERYLSTLAGTGDDHYRTSYIPDSLMDGYLEDYEDLLGDLFTPIYGEDGMPISGAVGMGTIGHGHGLSGPGSSPASLRPIHSPGRLPGDMSGSPYGPNTTSGYLSSAEQAWHRLGEILGDVDPISDSESIRSIGYLDLASSDDGTSEFSGEGGGPFGDEDDEDDDGDLDDLTRRRLRDEEEALESGRSDWDHLSPDLASALEEEEEERERAWAESDERDGRGLDSPGAGRRRRSVSPRSPRLRRSSSSSATTTSSVSLLSGGTPRSPALRPVFGSVEDDDDEYDEDGYPYEVEFEDGQQGGPGGGAARRRRRSAAGTHGLSPHGVLRSYSGGRIGESIGTERSGSGGSPGLGRADGVTVSAQQGVRGRRRSSSSSSSRSARARRQSGGSYFHQQQTHDMTMPTVRRTGSGGLPIPMTRSPRRSPHLSPQRIAIDEVEAFLPDYNPGQGYEGM